LEFIGIPGDFNIGTGYILSLQSPGLPSLLFPGGMIVSVVLRG